jgi:porphobilinogen synthase
MFLCEGKGIKEEINGMPGMYRLSLDLIIESAHEIYDLGIPAIALFPYIDISKKTPFGEESYNKDGLIPTAIKAIKDIIPELGLMADVALDPYTSHGQDGLIDDTGYILNDPTTEALIKQAITQVEAGVDIIAPSDMMDGRIGKIREALEENGHTETIIISYAAKYASALYGPFREAVGSLQMLGKSNKKSYQMDPANSQEAMHEVACDINEGADIVMVKPAGMYLDVINQVKSSFQMPVAAYQVSGEYSMLKMAIDNNLLNEDAILESLVAIKRAGADCILSYFSPYAARILTK